MKTTASGYLFCALLFSVALLHAQKQNNQWRFGRGGIDFNSRPPVNTPVASMLTQEGCASVADKNTGKLLFYTDGVTVWNAQDTPMPNGTGLSGGSAALLSSTTAAVIIPAPGGDDLYYIVTIDELIGRGLQYNIVDMRLDGGRGDVVTGKKNLPLLQTGTEKLEVVPHANGNDYWIITHDNSDFYAFLLSSSGFSGSPVVSSVAGSLGNTAGHLKVNRQFNMLACGSLFEAKMRLFGFNNSTGTITDLLSWSLAPAILKSSPLIYGVEFSPNGRLLYLSNLDAVVQYDVSKPNAAAVENSAFPLPLVGFGQPASLQLGPDNKIYINSGAIDVINCPDRPGSGCGYQPAVLNGGGYGLPKWVYYPGETFSSTPNGITATDSCLGRSVRFTLKDTTGVSSVSWNFGDAASGAGNNATGKIVQHNFSGPGTYDIRAIVAAECGQDTLFLRAFKVINCAVKGTTKISVSRDSCLKDSVYFNIVSNLKVDSVIVWDFGDTGSGSINLSVLPSPGHAFSKTGTFTVKCIVRLDCSKPPTASNPVVLPCFYLDTITTQVKIVTCEQEVIQECPFYVPNSFSPNDDGLNDKLEVFVGCAPEEYAFSVFNRWGGLVFTSNNPDEQWNGRLEGVDCPQGVYVTVLRYRFRSRPEETVCGSVTLLR